MIIGVPAEIKEMEFRVGMTPAGVTELTSGGHTVLVQQNAGAGSRISNGAFRAAGAEIVAEAGTIFSRAEMIVKVKEPLEAEYSLLQEGQIVFTYLHLAANPALLAALLERKVAAIAYETVQHDDGYLPLLAPMSEVAGRMAAQVAAHYLQKPAGGRGVLLAGVPGVGKGRVMILGTGTVAANAALIAAGLGARVSILGRTRPKLIRLEKEFDGRVRTLFLNRHNIEMELAQSEAVIGAVLVPGGRTPHLITRDMLQLLPEGAVIVDVSIDQGGCVETARPTTHNNPVYVEEGIVHYCVANMPGAVPVTSTHALTGVTLPYVKKIADAGLDAAMEKDPILARGLNIREGRITHARLAEEWQEISNTQP